MFVDPRDCTCAECNGVLQILETEDGAITIACTECGDCVTYRLDDPLYNTRMLRFPSRP